MIKNIYDSELDTYCKLGKAQERIDRLRGPYAKALGRR